MSDQACDDPEAQNTLALYALGGLTAEEDAEFESHLDRCPSCRAEVAQMRELLPMLDLLAEDGAADDLIARYGLPDDPPAPPPAPSAGTPVSSRGPSVSSRGPVVSPRGTAGSSRGRARLLARAAAAVLLVVAGAGGLVWLLLPHDDAIAPAGVSASVTDGSGGSLSVTVAETGGGSTVRGTVSGLATGRPYRLIATTSSGDTHVVAEWTGSGAVQAVSGQVPVPPAELTFFTVITADGTTVVHAPIGR